MKKFFTRGLLLVAMVLLSMTGMAQKFVLSENFELNQKPEKWTTAGQYWKFQNDEAVFEALIENGADTLFTPLVSLGELDNQPTVTITYRNIANVEKVNTLKVLYRSAQEGAWTELKVYEAATEGYVTDALTLPKDLENVQVAFAGAYLGGAATALDFVSIANRKEAVLPTGLRYEDLKPTSLTLWFDPCTSTKFVQYNMKINTKPMTDMSLMGDVMDVVNTGYTDEFIEVDGLTPNISYWFYVQYDCGDGDLSEWAVLEFRTPCSEIAAPYFDDFENGLDPCATIADDATNVSWLTTISTEYPYNSQHSLRFANNPKFYSYYFLPALNDDVKKYQVSFMVASSDASTAWSRDITVGVATSQTGNDFMELKTVSLPQGRKWEKVTISLAGYKGDGKYIALRTGNATIKNMIFVDNLSVEPQSACPMPMFVTVSEIASSSALVEWVEAGAASEWNLIVATRPVANPDDFEPDEKKGEFAGSVATNPYTMTNLLPSTSYFVYVQSACGSSEWTNVVEFKTNKAVKFPYFEDFGKLEPELYNQTIALPNGWVGGDRMMNKLATSTYDKPYSTTSTTYSPRIDKTKDHTDGAYVPASLLLKGTSISSPTATSGGYSAYVMLPALPVENLQDMAVTMWVYTTAAQTVKVGVAKKQNADLPQGQQFTEGTNVTELNSLEITTKSEWTKVILPLNQYKAEYGKFITIYLYPGTATPSVYIDDIAIDYAPDCLPVAELKSEAISFDSIHVSWRELLKATQWKVKVSTAEIDPATQDGDVKNFTATKTDLDLDALTHNTTYYVYVASTCEGAEWQMTSATTDLKVGLSVPYYNDFTDEPVGATATRGPIGWYLGYTYQETWTTSTYVPYCYNSAMSKAPADVVKPYLYLTNTTSASSQFPYAVMPELLNADVKDLVLNFYGYYNSATTGANYAVASDKSYYGVLKIGVVNNPKDINKDDKFTKVTEVAAVRCKAAQTPELMTVSMADYQGEGKYIVFYLDSAKYNYMGIDNLSITLSTAPQQVSEVAVKEITATGATATWKENGKATKWNVRVFSTAVADPDAADSVLVVKYDEVTAMSQAISGLQHSSRYFVYVQSTQQTGLGKWSTAADFWTECGKRSLPYVENFNEFDHGSTSLNTLSPCFMINDATLGNNYVKTGQATTSTTSATGPGTTYYYVDHTYGNDPSTNTFYMYAANNKLALLVLPEVEGDLANLTMRFYGSYASAFSATSSTMGGAVEICIMNADGSFTSIQYCKLSKAKEWEEFNITFPADIHSGRIAFRIDNNADWRKAVGNTYSGSVSCYMYIDDITVQEIPQCQKILDVSVGTITDSSAVISWKQADDETAWNVKVSSKPLTDPETETADAFFGQTTAKSQKVEGLLDNTTYYVYVQSVNDAKSCTGEWSNEISFITKCKAVAFPYYENFEDYADEQLLPCFTLTGNVTDITFAKAEKVSTYPNSWDGISQMTARLAQVDKANNNYFSLPLIAFDDVRKVQLSFKAEPQTTGWQYWEVGVMSDPDDPTTFVAIKKDSIEYVSGTRQWGDFMYTFEKYQGDESGNIGKYITVHVLPYKNASGTEYAGILFLDEITVGELITCPTPTMLKVDELSNDTAKLSWNSDAENTTYRVRVFTAVPEDIDAAAFVAETVSDSTSAIVKGLDGNNLYYAYARMECGENDNSKWSSVCTFRTDCNPVQALPYEEGFEDQTTGNTPLCWSAVTSTYVPSGAPGSSATTLKASISTTYKKSGAASMSISYGESKSAQAISPALDVTSLKDVLLYFDAYATADATLTIEALESASEDAEYIPLTQVNVAKSKWTFYSIDLGEYYTSAQPYKYIRFKAGKSTVYLDNVGFTTDKNKYFPVAELKVTGVGDTWLAYSFEEPTDISEWMVEYGPKGFEPGTGTPKVLSATEDTIKGLAPNTEYDIYVKGNVPAGQFAGPLATATCGAAASLPYITGFNDGADWVLINAINGKDYANIWAIDDATKCDATGDKALMIQHDGEYAWIAKYPNGDIGTSYVWAYRTINFSEVGTYKVNIKAKSQGGLDGGSDALYAGLVPAGATFSANTYKRVDGTAGSANLAANEAYNEFNFITKLMGTTSFDWYETNIDITTPGLYYLVFKWYNAAAYKPGQPAAIDSVKVEESPYSEVKNLELTYLDGEKASFQWTAGKCKDFQVIASYYGGSPRPHAMDAEDKLVNQSVQGTQFTLDNLLPNTTYSFYVRTVWPEGLFSAWQEIRFTTTCMLESAPYTETFIEAPVCWQLNGATATTKSFFDSRLGQTNADAETLTVLSTAIDKVIVLPEFDIPIQKMQVEYGMCNGTSLSTVTWGVLDNNFDVTSFRPIKIVPTQYKANSTGTYTDNTYETFSFMLNLVKETGRFLAFKTDVITYIDYITITELPDCITPQQVEITNITENAATVNWLAGTEEAWDIQVGNEIIPVTENPYTLTNLEQGTAYAISVRAKCDEQSFSEWSMPVTFMTECGVNKMPLFEDFAGLQASARAELPCWDNMLSDKAIESVFKGESVLYTPVKATYYNYLWTSCWLSKLGDVDQLMSWDYVSTTTQKWYKWMVAPQYEIEGSAQLSFDVRLCNNEGGKPQKDPVGRFFVAISTDNGATWKQEDATIIMPEEMDSVYTTKVMDLNKYQGQAIRVAFYHEGLSTNIAKNSTYIVIDNVSINCTDTYNFSDDACAEYDYEGNGFTIAKEDLAPAGESKDFTRFAKNVSAGCDSTVVLTLTTHKAATETVYESICRGEVFSFGPYELTEPNPEGTPYMITGQTVYGCDSTIYLYLTVNPSDTAQPVFVRITEDQLPYKVDEYYTIPEGTPVGSFVNVVKPDENKCSFNSYDVTISAVPTGTIPVRDAIEYLDVYDYTGRLVTTLRNLTESVRLAAPTGVYLLRGKMVSGDAVVERVVVE
ncbi:MAG: choice-of-anchor J domain-containing protein [Paludibacteraceae bacterium]|nr:choice-of-anchor J domain-containing protein [Paludibacteraceae bacterium]